MMMIEPLEPKASPQNPKREPKSHDIVTDGPASCKIQQFSPNCQHIYTKRSIDGDRSRRRGMPSILSLLEEVESILRVAGVEDTQAAYRNTSKIRSTTCYLPQFITRLHYNVLGNNEYTITLVRAIFFFVKSSYARSIAPSSFNTEVELTRSIILLTLEACSRVSTSNQINKLTCILSYFKAFAKISNKFK